MRELLRFFGYIMRELDRIEAERGLDVVVACDTDVMPAVIWHRMKRSLRYRIFRQEVDYYAGSRHRGKTLKARCMRWLFDCIEAVLHTQCDVIFTLNAYAARRISAWGIPANKVKITGLWKKDEYFADDHEGWKARLRDQGTITPPQYEVLKGRIVVSFLGFFYEYTHLVELFDVVAKFPGEFALILAGRGQDQPVVEDFARRHPNILFLGWHDEGELKALYKITDIVYQPLNPEENINWRYFGSTNKMFESLAAGCLFIGSAINERVDMNREAEFALLIDFHRDVRQQIEDLFRSILRDRNVLTRRQQNARTLYQRYNHANHVRIWRALVEGRG
jgi:glycosyltransferase involved in cell wall biosynthesis